MEAELPAIREGTAPSLADRQVTLGEYLETWLLSDPDWRPSTVATYRGTVSNYLRPSLGHLRLAALRPDHIRGMLAQLRDRGLSARTVGQAFATLRAALNQAVADQRMTRNPCDPLTKGKKGKKGRKPARPALQVWTPEQVTLFLAHAREAEPRLAPAFQLAAWRGLRRGELVGLQWGDLDLDAGKLSVERNVTEVDRELHVGEPKTERGERTVSIGPKLAAVLREHRDTQPVRRLGADWVFTDERGEGLWPHVLTHTFKRLALEVPGLPEMHLHGLRHTAATHMLLAGIAPKVVQDALGHATLAMTMDTYGHVLPQQRDASADAVERLYGGS
jgi:integrase